MAGDIQKWSYPQRREAIVFLLKGRNTPASRVIRCLASLRAQDDQDFGIILIDDASDQVDPTPLPSLLGALRPRTTLIRRNEHVGRMPNFRDAISQICANPETLVVVLDLDDALMAPSVVSRLRQAHGEGHDVILGACFRPDKPLKLYEPNFDTPRETWGGEVWPHLRSFRKRLFDAVPESYFQIDGTWIEECTDYATMVPIVELAARPLYIREYLYFHERSTPRTPESLPVHLTADDFLSGNPGLQGSNTFVALSALERAGDFTDGLPSLNDRDLAVRLLSLPDLQIAYTGEWTANWHHGDDPVSLSAPRSVAKIAGLQAFWRMHGPKMSQDAAAAYFDRAWRFFSVSREEIMGRSTG
ncbi:MAG: glycosyltransferase [Alphaproteobacteria bacterium]|nr:glycosyltransferase [Alphaproteobacteria bacterium]